MSNAKEHAALSSIAASVVITIGKGVAGLTTGSLALISDAAHSLLDVAATVITYLAIRAASKPADEKHHFGHGKIESMAALIETAFLFLLAGGVALEGIRRLWEEQVAITVNWLAIVVLVVSIAIDSWRWWALSKVARETNSEALAADALHFSSDLINSVLVLAAFGASALGYHQADSLVAIGVALFIAFAGFRLARRTIGTLVDAAPVGVAEEIRSIAEGLSGVVAVEQVRVRPSGAQLFVEIEIAVARTMPLDRLPLIKDSISFAIRAVHNDANVTVTATPRALDEETVLERVLLIAAKRHLPVHHVTVQDLDEKLSVSLDLEINGHATLGEAHVIASQLETAIRDELGENTEVETHIEPLVVSSLRGKDVDNGRRTAVSLSLTAHAAADGPISDIHNVRVRETEHGLIVNYHCRLLALMDVTTMHEAVDQLERKVRQDFPDILRIVSHTEPVREPAIKS